MFHAFIGGGLIAPFVFVQSSGIMASAFWEFWYPLPYSNDAYGRMVQGICGVVPIYLIELSPPHLRVFVWGTTYQLGNLVSSASTTIESKLGERFSLSPDSTGAPRYDYGKVMGSLKVDLS